VVHQDDPQNVSEAEIPQNTTIVLIPASPPFRSVSKRHKIYKIKSILGGKKHDQWKAGIVRPLNREEQLSGLAEMLAILVSSISIAIIGGLTHFQGGTSSTLVQKAFTMTWLGWGIFSGQIVAWINRPGDRLRLLRVFWEISNSIIPKSGVIMKWYHGFGMVILAVLYCVGAYGQCQEYSCRGPGHALRIYRRHLFSWITADDDALLRISGSLERACSMLYEGRAQFLYSSDCVFI
jgi:hypothetical protein